MAKNLEDMTYRELREYMEDKAWENKRECINNIQPGVEYTTSDIANLGGGFLDGRSFVRYLSRSIGGLAFYKTDRNGVPTEYVKIASVKKKTIEKHYVNVNDPNDTMTVKRKGRKVYTFDIQ